MLKKSLAALMALILLAACLPVGAEQASSAQPDCFIPEKIADAFNDAVTYTIGNIGSMSQADKDALIQFMRVGFTESTEENNAFFDNTDWSVEITGQYGDRLPDIAQPAGVILLTLHGDGLDADKMLLARGAFVAAISVYDPSSDFNALYAWITEASENGARIDLDGYHLELKRVEDIWIYALQYDSTGIALDDSDALQSLLSDYLEDDKPKSEEADTPEPTPTPTPTPTPAPTPTPNPNLLVDWNGFSVELLRIEPRAYSSGEVTLAFFCRFINHSDYEIDMFVKEAEVDGVPVDGVGQMDIAAGADTGSDSDEYFFVKPETGERYDDGVIAICNARRLEATLLLRNGSEDLYTQPISLSLLSVPSFTPQPTASPAPSDGKSALDRLREMRDNGSGSLGEYDTLCRGDRGDGVAQMQLELIDLGYLSGKADGVFGAQTAEAVRLFSEANGLGSSEIATPEMQQKLFSYGAKAYEEPYVPLVIKAGAYGQWKKRSGNKISMRVKVTNVSRTKTIKAFEMYMYAEDVYGCRIYGDNTVYYGTTTKKVKPGETVYCDYITMPNRSDVYTVYAGVKKVVFTDGTVHENASVSYADWTINW